MTESNKIPLEEALPIAEKYVELFRPHCEWIAIAGSIRREVPMVKDIEIVCIPKTHETDAEQPDIWSAEKVTRRVPGFIDLVNSLKKVRGLAEGKYTQRLLPEGIALDLFMADRDNLGLIYVIRTGPVDFSKRIVDIARKSWYRVDGGYMWRSKKIVPCRNEREFFELIQYPYVPPQRRS